MQGWQPTGGPGGLFEVVPDKIPDLPVREESSSVLACSYTTISTYHYMTSDKGILNLRSILYSIQHISTSGYYMLLQL